MDVALKDGIAVSVSDDLDEVSTWSALEHEDWFEDELNFVRSISQPHWNVIDIGANHGAYALALARAGVNHVWAFEPTSEPMARLRASVDANGLEGSVTLIQVAVSDRQGTGCIELGERSEYSALANPGDDVAGGYAVRETVEVTTLDDRFLSSDPPSIDFVKIDAEGAEMAILDGGTTFFSVLSPLIMCEYKHRQETNIALLKRLPAMGYSVHVLVPGLNALRRFDPTRETADDFLLNIFAFKSDRADELERQGYLVTDAGGGERDSAIPLAALDRLLSLPMVSADTARAWRSFDFSSPYGRALLAWSASRDTARSANERFALLEESRRLLAGCLAGDDFHPAVTVLAIRVLADLGERARAVQAAESFIGQIDPHDMPIDRPVPPAYSLFDSRHVEESLAAFLHQSVVELFVSRRVFVGLFMARDERICAQFGDGLRSAEHSDEFERRAVLYARHHQLPLPYHGLRWLLRESAANAAFWQPVATGMGCYVDGGALPPAELIKRGEALIAEKDAQGALPLFFEACERAPALHRACFLAGLALMRLKRGKEAAEKFRDTLRLKSDYWQAANNLGLVLTDMSEFGQAEPVFRNALVDFPDVFDLNFNFSRLLRDTGRHAEAIYYLKQAKRISPHLACVPDMIGSILILMSRTLDALPCLQRAVALEPDWAQPWNNLGRCHFIRGQLDEADRCYERSLSLQPQFLAAWTNLLMTKNYRANDPQETFELHRRFGVEIRKSLGPQDFSRLRIRAPGQRRLRLGFVSADFRRHSVSYFIEGVLEKFDRSAFELYAYFSHKADERTHDFKRFFDLWRDIQHVSDEDVSRRIINDGIDILFDLTGHTTGNRLAVFAARSAPVQVMWIGYPNTSGLDSMDYRITDQWVDPPGDSDRLHTETLWRLPGPFLCYTPPAGAPEVGPLPASSNGYVTFGSFNSGFKLGDETLALWVAVLKRVADSRIVIKSPVGLGDEEARERLRERFTKSGIELDRVIVESARGELFDHLQLYNSIDIALDPFPYNGTTTTFESLWMGVPVVSLTGPTHASRVGASILQNAGLPQLIADAPECYVEIAAQLAEQPEVLTDLRAGMRNRLTGSVLLDSEGMTRKLEHALQEMWQAFLESPAGKAVGVRARKFRGPSGRLLLLPQGQGGENTRVAIGPAGNGWDQICCDICNLSSLEEGEYNEIYCCYQLQRLGVAEMLPALSGLRRILASGGRLYASVPDLDALAGHLGRPDVTTEGKFGLMRQLFGMQSRPDDFNSMGLNEALLRSYLREAGFSSVDRVDSFACFDDESEATFDGERVSLNVVAYR